MKTTILATFAILTTLPYASAQNAPLKMNCSALKGQPQVCLVNDTDDQVTDIGCKTTGGLFHSGGERTVDVPKGGIPAHSMVIVNMKDCNTSLVFTILGGVEREIPHVNTKNSTMIEVPKR